MRILVIEDEPLLNARLRDWLIKENYRVDTAHDGQEGLYLAQESQFDAAIIDLGLPKLSGIDIIKTLRQAQNPLPILVLTARDRWQDKVEGLEAGADDYLGKPFEPAELLARLKALLRRASGKTQQQRQFGPLSVDQNNQSAALNQQPLELTPYEYRLLDYLIRHRERIVTKQELNSYLYPVNDDPDSNVIEVLVGRLRKKLDPDGQLHPIETLRGRGYRFALQP